MTRHFGGYRRVSSRMPSDLGCSHSNPGHALGRPPNARRLLQHADDTYSRSDVESPVQQGMCKAMMHFLAQIRQKRSDLRYVSAEDDL